MKVGLILAAALVSMIAAIHSSASWSQQSTNELATSFPLRPVQVVVPFAAGGSSDVVIRLLAQTVSKNWNQPIVIDNRVGATGAIAGEFVVRQPADGYTLLNVAPTSHTALRALRRDLPYDPMADLTPATLLVIAPMILVVNPKKVPAQTVQELIDYLKKNPGKLSYASTGIGSVAHLSIELFKDPYRHGFGPRSLSRQRSGIEGHARRQCRPDHRCFLLCGQSFEIGGAPFARRTTAKRTLFDPDLPTVAETVPDFEAFSWNGIVVRTGTPLLC